MAERAVTATATEAAAARAVTARVDAVLADLADVDRRARARKDRSHWDGCWREHTRCLAAHVRATLTGEDTTDA